MRAVYDHIRNLDPVVAAKISPQSATEKEAELHWAITRLLCLDRAFDMLMYVNVIPRIVFEMLKRNFGCGFINDGAKRVLTRHSYLRNYPAADYPACIYLRSVLAWG